MRSYRGFALLMVMMFLFTACSTSQEESKMNGEVPDSVELVDKDEIDKRDFSHKLNGEDGKVRWIRGSSGNIMMTAARENGILDEYGLDVEMISINDTQDAFATVRGGNADVTSNQTTVPPLQRIGAGDDLIIFGGNLASGSVSIAAKAGTEWNGIEDLVGKRVAGYPTEYPMLAPLFELGYDPITDIEWVNLTGDMDALTALKNDLVDYARIGTSLNYQSKQDPGIDTMVHFVDLMEDYSCCRMNTNSSFLHDKSNTAKALLKALMRGYKAYIDDPATTREQMAEEVQLPVEVIDGLAVPEHGYNPHPDPLYNALVTAWLFIDEMGMFDDKDPSIQLRDHVDVEFYKEALDEVIDEVGDEDPEFWQGMLDYFEKNNSMYYDQEEEAQYIEEFLKRAEENRAKRQ